MTRQRRLPGGQARRRVPAGEAGHSLVEALVIAACVMTLGAVTLPALGGQRDAIHAAAAARHVGTAVYQVRADALRRGSHAGLVFRTLPTGIRSAEFADGNHNGVLAADIAAGIDRQVTTWSSLGDDFPRAAFGIVPGATDPETGAPLTGSPLKLGGSSILSCGPDGTATSGTLYVRGPAKQQYAVRILGATGRTRTLRFDFAAGTWSPL